MACFELNKSKRFLTSKLNRLLGYSVIYESHRSLSQNIAKEYDRLARFDSIRLGIGYWVAVRGKRIIPTPSVLLSKERGRILNRAEDIQLITDSDGDGDGDGDGERMR